LGPAEKRAEYQEIVVLYCQGCIEGKADRADELHTADGVRTRLVVVPCTSKVELPHLLKILERGADGVQVVGCGQNACRFLVGSNVAAARVARARDLLDDAGVGAERLGMSRGAGLDVGDLRARGRQRAEAARVYGANPMKQHPMRRRTGRQKERLPSQRADHPKERPPSRRSDHPKERPPSRRADHPKERPPSRRSDHPKERPPSRRSDHPKERPP